MNGVCQGDLLIFFNLKKIRSEERNKKSRV